MEGQVDMREWQVRSMVVKQIDFELIRRILRTANNAPLFSKPAQFWMFNNLSWSRVHNGLWCNAEFMQVLYPAECSVVSDLSMFEGWNLDGVYSRRPKAVLHADKRPETLL